MSSLGRRLLLAVMSAGPIASAASGWSGRPTLFQVVCAVVAGLLAYAGVALLEPAWKRQGRSRWLARLTRLTALLAAMASANAAIIWCWVASA